MNKKKLKVKIPKLKDSDYHDIVNEEIIPDNDGITKDELVELSNDSDLSSEANQLIPKMLKLMDKIESSNKYLVEYLNMCDELTEMGGKFEDEYGDL